MYLPSLREQGAIISDADILVAAIAVTNNLVLVTNTFYNFSLTILEFYSSRHFRY